MELQLTDDCVIEKISGADLNIFPSTLVILTQEAGVREAYFFVKEFGGSKIYIPKYPERSHLKYILPNSLLGQLSKYYGGELVEVPKIDHFERYARNQLILEMIVGGKKNGEIAKRFSLSYRQVANIKRRHRNGEV